MIGRARTRTVGRRPPAPPRRVLAGTVTCCCQCAGLPVSRTRRAAAPESAGTAAVGLGRTCRVRSHHDGIQEFQVSPGPGAGRGGVRDKWAFMSKTLRGLDTASFPITVRA